MREQVDESDGTSTRVIIESKDPEVRPASPSRTWAPDDTEAPAPRARPGYLLPSGSNNLVDEGQKCRPATSSPRSRARRQDQGHTGGLPRVAELFEARKAPKEYALISEIDGISPPRRWGMDISREAQDQVVPEVGAPRIHDRPRGKAHHGPDGERIRAGEALMDGFAESPRYPPGPRGQELARFLVNEIQEVYGSRGCGSTNKHIETIVRQMLRRSKITDPGDTSFLVGRVSRNGSSGRKNERL